jgi:hypothetical protein
MLVYFHVQTIAKHVHLQQFVQNVKQDTLQTQMEHALNVKSVDVQTAQQVFLLVAYVLLDFILNNRNVLLVLVIVHHVLETIVVSL